MTDMQALVIAYQQQFEAVRTCEANEPPYSDMPAHRVWEQALADLREDLAKAHVRASLAMIAT